MKFIVIVIDEDYNLPQKKQKSENKRTQDY